MTKHYGSKLESSRSKSSVVAKGLVAGMLLVGINVAGAATAFADTAQSSNSTNQTTTNSTNTTVAVQNSTAAGSTTDASAGTLPGDFFYFIKTTVENIRLAFTFHDVAKAELLAQYAQQRIAEANALIAKGETTLAQQTLQQAVTDENAALKLANQSGTSLNFGSTNGISNTTSQGTGNGVSTNQSGNSVSTTSNNATGSVDITVLNNTTSGTQDNNALSTNGTADNGVVNGTENGTENGLENNEVGEAGAGNDHSKTRAKVYAHLGQDTLALAAALQHVKNPTAQAALERNIEKSLAHLQTQLGVSSKVSDKAKADASKDSKVEGKKDSDASEGSKVTTQLQPLVSNSVTSTTTGSTSVQSKLGDDVQKLLGQGNHGHGDSQNHEHGDSQGHGNH